MVLDPLSAVSLAGNIITFLEFSGKLVSGAHEIYHSSEGITETQQRYDAVATSFAEIGCRLRVGLGSTTNLTSDEQDLDKLAQACEKEANELSLAVRKLGVSKDKNLLKGLQQSFRGLRKQGTPEGYEQRLRERREGLSLLIVAITKDKITSIQKVLQELSDKSTAIEIDQKERFDQIHASLTSIRSSEFSGLYAIIQNLLSNIPALDKEQKILSSLQFPQIRLRHAAIDDNHVETFRWIFQSNADQESRTKIGFTEWLESSSAADRVFWVGGKAGSGKSTLMKFVCNHPETLQSLRRWAGSHKLVIASHFFWYAGNDLQRSQEGLLRTLLLQIFRSCPDQIASLFPNRWNNVDHEYEMEWTTRDLTDAFSLLKSISSAAVRFCFFVDGLDEYIGDPQSIVDAIHLLCDSENIKTCVSSRPWPVFLHAFEQNHNRRILMQELTRDDIKKYVSDRLEANSGFIQAKQRDQNYQILVETVIQKAQGVFL